jgi:hypothetical protein
VAAADASHASNVTEPRLRQQQLGVIQWDVDGIHPFANPKPIPCPAAKWVSTDIDAKGLDSATATGFWRVRKGVRSGPGQEMHSQGVRGTQPADLLVHACGPRA